MTTVTASRFGPFVLDPDSRQLLRSGELVHVPPKAFELLELLAERRPRPVSSTEIRAHLWPGQQVTRANLAKLVVQLRVALGDDARAPRYLRTVRGFGFALSADGADAERARAAGRFRLRLPDRDVALSEGGTVLGRGDEAGIRIVSSTVSRRHARIWVAGTEAVIEDLGSKNGSFVGERRVTASLRLRDGDEIRLGSVWMTFFESSGSTETSA
jgi:DNA-binding winged helix-turn-helix (wHTH) protein